MLAQVLDFVACHVWGTIAELPVAFAVATIRRGTPRPYTCPVMNFRRRNPMTKDKYFTPINVIKL